MHGYELPTGGQVLGGCWGSSRVQGHSPGPDGADGPVDTRRGRKRAFPPVPGQRLALFRRMTYVLQEEDINTLFLKRKVQKGSRAGGREPATSSEGRSRTAAGSDSTCCAHPCGRRVDPAGPVESTAKVRCSRKAVQGAHRGVEFRFGSTPHSPGT